MMSPQAPQQGNFDRLHQPSSIGNHLGDIFYYFKTALRHLSINEKMSKVKSQIFLTCPSLLITIDLMHMFRWVNHTIGLVQALNACISVTNCNTQEDKSKTMPSSSPLKGLGSQLISQVSTHFPILQQNYFILIISFVSPFSFYIKPSTLSPDNKSCFQGNSMYYQRTQWQPLWDFVRATLFTIVT